MPSIELLSSHHNRRDFDCGHKAPNEFLQRQARQNADRNVGVTHVAVPSPGDSRVLGYYTLLPRTIECDLLPSAKQLPQGSIGVVLLGRLAVDQSAQKQGLGTHMLLRAMRQTERAARDIGIHALVLDALDDAARSWYLALDFGFQELRDDPRHLFLPVATIQQIGQDDG